jgi:isopenicillin N synthase-like dioxygenase
MSHDSPTAADDSPIDFSKVPVIDISALVHRGSDSDRLQVARQLGQACCDVGFFYVVGHGIPDQLVSRLEELSRQFFSLPIQEKMEINMALGGRAWRGYFPVGDELTSGKPDLKEGLYLGQELDDQHPDVLAGTPLHGRNLFPRIEGFRETVLEYLAAATQLGHSLMSGMALSLGLDQDYFNNHYTGDPFVLFRIFNYPCSKQNSIGLAERADSIGNNQPRWGVGEHTDYGLITILKQDDSGGLQVKSCSRWIDAPPITGSFICNIGDMLERLTRGIYRSTPHRVLNLAKRDRISFPVFFDPNFHSPISPIQALAQLPVADDRNLRWDHANVHDFQGTYGDYLLQKVSKVFPQLTQEVI